MKKICCVACSAEMKKGSRDHVFPEALGSFRNALICRSFCGRCNGAGGGIEKSLFHESFFTGIRDYLGIRSKKAKGEPFVDQVKKLRQRGMTETVDVQVVRDGLKLRPDFKGDGPPSADLPSIAELRYADGRIEVLELTGMTPDEIAERLAAVLKESKLQVLIKSNEDNLTQVTNLLKGKGFPPPEPIQLEPLTGEVVRTQGTISGELNFTHIRALGFMLLKALLLMGYDSEDLVNLTELVFRGLVHGVSFEVRTGNSAKGTLFQVDQHMLSHSIQWNAGNNAIFGTVSLFMSSDHLIGVIFKVAYPRPKKILAPPYYPGRGFVRAIYDPYVSGSGIRPGAGECQKWIDETHRLRLPDRAK